MQTTTYSSIDQYSGFFSAFECDIYRGIRVRPAVWFIYTVQFWWCVTFPQIVWMMFDSINDVCVFSLNNFSNFDIYCIEKSRNSWSG